MTLAGVVWHFWIAVPLAALGVLGAVATAIGYAKNVTSQRYPKGSRR
jgi:hypothetical protein